MKRQTKFCMKEKHLTFSRMKNRIISHNSKFLGVLVLRPLLLPMLPTLIWVFQKSTDISSSSTLFTMTMSCLDGL